MRIATVALAAFAALALTACNNSPAEQAAEERADAIEERAEVQADALEQRADEVREAADQRADAVEQQATPAADQQPAPAQ
jgi:hypothetical protein